MTSAPSEIDFAVVGAGILGLAVARELGMRWPDRRIAVLERDARGRHRPDGRQQRRDPRRHLLQARLAQGAALRDRRARALLVLRAALDPARALRQADRRASRRRAAAGSTSSSGAAARTASAGCAASTPTSCGPSSRTPRGVAALDSPSTGIVDFAAVARSLAAGLRDARRGVVTGCAVETVSAERDRVVLGHAQGETPRRLRRLLRGRGGRPARGGGRRLARSRASCRSSGTYLYLRPERSPPRQVAHLSGAGPRPTLPRRAPEPAHRRARARSGPARSCGRATPATLAWPGTLGWRGAGGARAAPSSATRCARPTFAAAAAQYVPELRPEDFDGGFHGVRAQAIARDGRLVDDFVVSETPRALHVRNAPSPAATSSLALARLICDRVDGRPA